MRRTAIVLVMVSLATSAGGCASTSRSTATDQERTVLLDEHGGERVVGYGSDGGGGYSSSVPQSPQVTFAAVQTVYEQMKLPVTALHPAELRVAAVDVQVGHSIDGQRLSRFFDCGMDAASLYAADTYDLLVTVTTAVAAPTVPNGPSTVTTRASARARHQATGSQAVTCQSSGRLEARIARAIASNLTG